MLGKRVRILVIKGLLENLDKLARGFQMLNHVKVQGPHGPRNNLKQSIEP